MNKLKIPILFNHDSSQLIGKFDEDGILTFKEGFSITTKQAFEIFGNCSFLVMNKFICEKTGEEKIKKLKIMEWSLNEEV